MKFRQYLMVTVYKNQIYLGSSKFCASHELLSVKKLYHTFQTIHVFKHTGILVQCRQLFDL